MGDKEKCRFINCKNTATWRMESSDGSTQRVEYSCDKHLNEWLRYYHHSEPNFVEIYQIGNRDTVQHGDIAQLGEQQTLNL